MKTERRTSNIQLRTSELEQAKAEIRRWFLECVLAGAVGAGIWLLITLLLSGCSNPPKPSMSAVRSSKFKVQPAVPSLPAVLRPPPKPIRAFIYGWDHGKDEVPKNITIDSMDEFGGTEISYPCDFLLASDTPNGTNWTCIRTCLLAQTQSVIVSNTRPQQYFRVVPGWVSPKP